LKLVYFTGGPRERVLASVLASGHRVERIYVNDPERWPKVQKSIDIAREFGIDVHVVRKKADLTDLSDEIAGKICLSAGFNYIFSSDLLAKAQVIINVHGSLLPKYAGARTLSWAIVDGERESGVTVHRVDAGIDTGPVLLQRRFDLSPFETTRSLARKTGDLEPSVVVEALRRYEELGDAAFQPQSGEPQPLRPNRIPAHSQIDPRKPLIELLNNIRASDPDNYPAFFYLHGQKVCVRVWRPEKPEDEADLV
jgi:methionyl-tRNA formyltransferase